MKLKSTYYYLLGLIIIIITLVSFQKPESYSNFSETVKVALRDAGNKLLLANKDSASLVLPIRKVEENRYEIAFERKLSISPDSLVTVVNSSLKSANLPKRYIVEVINCETEAVSYSFQISGTKEKNIVPCNGRNLPKDCYTIHILFIENDSNFSSISNYILLIILILTLAFVWLVYFRKKTLTNSSENGSDFTTIGHYKFYETQNKLVKDAIEIKLSSKECELMQMFSSNQNQVIKRDLLIKKIWEDNGVFVGRSLDTFISKLRKKFKDDDSINIVNVHGVGYKLEVN